MSAAKRTAYVFLAIGLVAASQSGNIVRLADAHPFAVATWRLIIATVLLGLLANKKLAQLQQLSLLQWILLIISGITLAFHFFTWIGAVQHTTVANATIFLSINPVLTAIGARLLYRERLTWALACAIGVGLIGVLFLGWHDATVNEHMLFGNMLALICAILFSMYFLIGKRLRNNLSTDVYVTALYGIAALCGLCCMLLAELPLVAYSGKSWLSFVLLALFPTMVGHTSFNHALKYLPAARISTLTLTEVPMAGIVAFFAFREQVYGAQLVGYGLIAGAVVLLMVPAKTKNEETRQAA